MFCDVENELIAYIDEKQDEIVDILRALIKLPSENSGTSGNEKLCQMHVRDLYEKLGLKVNMYTPDEIKGIKTHKAYLKGRNYTGRPNVTGVYKAVEGADALMLAAHADVVPAGDRAGWKFDPWSGKCKNGRIYGRGAGDNKAGLAAAYFALKAVMDCGIELKKNVILTSFVDEEFGGGNGSLAVCLRYPCKSYVILDGIKFNIEIMGVGGGGFNLTVKTRETCSDARITLKALNYIIERLDEFAARRKNEFDRHEIYGGTDIPDLAFRVTEVGIGTGGEDLGEGKLTCFFFTLKDKAEIEKELNDIFGASKEALDGMKADIGRFEWACRFFDVARTKREDPVVGILSGIIKDLRGEVKITGGVLSDFGIYNNYGSKSSINIGISRLTSEEGGFHQPNEYIEVKDLLDLTKSIAILIFRWCNGI